jgi:hypothetical protein
MCSMSYYNVNTNEVMKYDHLIEMNDRHNQLMNALENLTTLVVPGVLPMKQVELWRTWGQCIPEDQQHYLCPPPPDEVLHLVESRIMNNRTNNNKKRQRND